MMRAVLGALAAVLAFGVLAAEARAPGPVRTFARVPSPGQPEAIAVARDGTVYVGTNQGGQGPAAGSPSRVFAFSGTGRLRRSYGLRGQALGAAHGIQGGAFDGRGRLYLLDRSAEPRVVVLDPRTGAQRTYARFADVPTCAAAHRRTRCSATGADRPAFPNYPAFTTDGTLWVTDSDQALVWRIAPGGGRPRVWFTDHRLDADIGPNGLGVVRSGRALLLAQTLASRRDLTGRLFELPIRRDGRPGRLRTFWRTQGVDGPDGFAIGRSGRVYVALAASNALAVVSPRGRELRRTPATPVANARLPRPFDGPASVAFRGRDVLVTNQSVARADPRSWAVLDVRVGERGQPLFRPRIGRSTRRR
jgi:sugar lactone lactonase YvrE